MGLPLPPCLRRCAEGGARHSSLPVPRLCCADLGLHSWHVCPGVQLCVGEVIWSTPAAAACVLCTECTQCLSLSHAPCPAC